MKFENSLSFAQKKDQLDPLNSFRNKFLFPKVNGKTAIYFAGNSLGLQPRSVKKFIEEELDDWARLGVEGHVKAARPWLYYHKFSKKALSQLTGAKISEVVSMNQLTVNLHLLMVTFFKPTPKRFKIITEYGAFSSDQYAFESQLRFHGLDPDECLIEVKPREGESILRTEDILQVIDEHAPELAMVVFGAVQYYTGQFFNVKKITEAAHEAGALAGFDLAHAIGNVTLNLHQDDVDFAVWCSYKYLNSGPGGIAGAFVHQRHAQEFDLPRFAGWWGHSEEERFQMKKGFKPMAGIDGWQISNVPILQAAAHRASLHIFQAAGIKNLCKKSEMLTGYLEYLLHEIDDPKRYFHILTPSNPKERGCQLSIFMKKNGKKVFQNLVREGIIADWREPNVIRVAPVPLYNTFEDVYKFGQIFKRAL
jgi:kynureninase